MRGPGVAAWRGHLAALDGQDAELALVGAAGEVQRHVLAAGGGHPAQLARLQPAAAAAAAAQPPLVPLPAEVRLRGSIVTAA